jgi:hypothetical protein
MLRTRGAACCAPTKKAKKGTGLKTRHYKRKKKRGTGREADATGDLVEAGGDGFDYGAVGVVVFQGPDKGAAEATEIRVTHL